MSNVIVTGGSGALGRAVVGELGRRGHRIVVVDLAPIPAGLDLVAGLDGVDLTDEATVAGAYAAAADALGTVDGLVNAAGGFVWEPVAGGSLGSWDRMLAMNLRTALVSARAVIAHLAAPGGAIVNVGAAAAAAPGTGMAPYAASKAGVAALTASLADELKPRGIRVNAILPTTFDTPVNRADMPGVDPAGWVQLADAARVIAFLLSDDAGSITGEGIRLSLGRPAP